MGKLTSGPESLRLAGLESERRRRYRAFRPALGVERCEERVLLSLALVSVSADGTTDGNGPSVLSPNTVTPGLNTPGGGSGAISADGNLLVFASAATNLVSGGSTSTDAPNANSPNVYVRNMATGQTTLVSATPDGDPSSGDSFQPIISPDGRYVAFLSTASDLTNKPLGLPQVGAPGWEGLLYVRDLQTQTTTLVDLGANGHAANGSATGIFAFSPDGSTLAFFDSATNLTNTPVDSANAPGATGPGVSNFTPGYDLYAYTLATGTTTPLTLTPSGQLSQGNQDYADSLALSPDGSKLAFTFGASDMLPGSGSDSAPSTDGSGDNLPPQNSNVFVTDLATDTTTLVSATPDGQPANSSSTNPVFSPDGTRVAYLSWATNLTATPVGNDELSGNNNLFVYNLTSQTNTLVTATTGATLSVGQASNPVFSPDGTALAYISTGTDLTANTVDPAAQTGSEFDPGWGFGGTNAFVYTFSSGKTTAVSTTPGGQLSNGSIEDLTYTPDGQSLAYLSGATDLTSNPYTPPAESDGFVNLENLFVTNVGTGVTTLVSVTPDGQLSNSSILTYAFSPDGTSVAFTDSASDLTNNPPADPSAAQADGILDPASVFVRDLTAGTTTLLSAQPDGTLPIMGTDQLAAYTPLIYSPDSQTLYFNDSAALVPTATDGTPDIYAATAPWAAPGEAGFASWQFNAQESGGQAVVTVVRNAPLDAAASVDYATQDGTATAGTDYQATSGTLNFAPGQSSSTFTVPLSSSDAFSGTLTANLTLSNPSGVTVGIPTATLNLIGSIPAAPTTTPQPTPIDAASTATPTPSPTPTSTPTPTPAAKTPPVSTPTPASTTSSASTTSQPAVNVARPGPVVSGVTLQKKGHKVKGLAVSFSAPLTSGRAENVANYAVNQLRMGRRRRHGAVAIRSVKAVQISAVSFVPGAATVMLRFKSAISAGQAVQLRINGGQGGLTDVNGNSLNSPAAGAAGSDFVGTWNG